MSTKRTVVTKMTLDMFMPDIQKTVTVTQGDVNRRFEITLVDSGRPFRLGVKWTVALAAVKPSGAKLYNSCIVDNGKIIYDFAGGAEIATEPGAFEVQFDIYDEVGEVVASPKIWLSVLVNRNREMQSEDQFTATQDILRRLNETEEQKLAMVQEAVESVEAVESKIESAESSRLLNETARQNNESARQSNESARQSKEVERQIWEQARVKAEQDRASASAAAVTNANDAAARAAEIAEILQGKLDNGEYTGEQGLQGLQGVPGEPGKPFSIEKTYNSIEAMNAGFSSDGVSEGGFVVITSGVDDEDNAKLFLKGNDGYVFITDLSGAQGMEGPQGKQGPQGIPGGKGDPGANGKDGADGKSAYAYAQEGGYTGTEEEFAADLAKAISGGNVSAYNGEVEVV